MKKINGQFGLGALERFATSFHADYRFGPINIMVLLFISLVGLIVYVTTHPFDLQVVITMLGAALSLAVLLRISQIWETAIVLTAVSGFVAYLRHRPDSTVLVLAVVLAGFLSPCIQMAYQWEKAVVLRFGKFHIIIFL